MSETTWSAGICSFIRKRGVMVRPLTGNVFDPIGWPDKLLIIPGYGLKMVEFKGETTKIEDHQKQVIAKIHNTCPGSVVICRKYHNGGVFLHPIRPHTELFRYEQTKQFLSYLLKACQLLEEE